MIPQTQITGRMGELVLEYELLRRGWLAGNTNASMKNFYAWDIFAFKDEQTLKFRVKAKRENERAFRWSATKSGEIFPNLQEDDYVAAISFDRKIPCGYQIYIIPSRIVQEELMNNHALWLSGTKRDGGKRKDTTQRNLYLDNRTDKPSHGYAKKWAPYKDAWGLLE